MSYSCGSRPVYRKYIETWRDCPESGAEDELPPTLQNHGACIREVISRKQKTDTRLALL